MIGFFLNIVNMSISASWIVLAVLLLRLLLRKAPKWLSVLLWGIVAVRLICPFTFESSLSLIPSAETISPDIMTDKTPQVSTGIPIINSAINPVISGSLSPDTTASVNPLRILLPILSAVWIAGAVLLLAYTAISYWRLKRKIGTAVLLRDNIFQSETVISPFVLGIIKPKIYLPFNISEQNMEHVIAHEQAHIRRKDHWWKPLGFLLLTLHWFNPLMWLGYVLLCRDIELACDEKVVKEMNTAERADYSQALLTCSVNRRMIAACPLAFGEVGVKERVKSVLNYKKPAFWIIIVAIIASVVAAVCLLTDPASNRLKNIESLNLNAFIDETITVWVGDGESYHLMGVVSKDLLQDLTDIKISKNEISPDRDEDRDKSHTLVLQTKEDADPTAYSYLKGLYIHFNSDFTEVWVDTGVKPTLSYRVINPKKAQDVYDYIANYNVSESVIGADDPTAALSADMSSFIEKLIVQHHNVNYISGDFCCADYKVLGVEKNKEYTTVYMWVLYREYTDENGFIMGGNGAHVLTAITINEKYKKLLLEEYWEPSFSSYYADGIREKFPEYLYEEALDSQRHIKELQANCDKKAQEYFSTPEKEAIVVDSYKYGYVLDVAVFDIDGDGEDELCVLGDGRTSGVYTFTLSVSENGVLEYFNIFSPSPIFFDPHFGENAFGEMMLLGEYGYQTLYMSLSVDNGNIVIMRDGQDIPYWGEQGIDSPNAPKL